MQHYFFGYRNQKPVRNKTSNQLAFPKQIYFLQFFYSCFIYFFIIHPIALAYFPPNLVNFRVT
jgi:hypothetical protein